MHNAHSAEVNVYAAASLTDVTKEIAPAYEKQSSDKITFNFAASSLLARQIAEGAPADIFFSADEAKMDDLQKAGLIVPEILYTGTAGGAMAEKFTAVMFALFIVSTSVAGVKL